MVSSPGLRSITLQSDELKWFRLSFSIVRLAIADLLIYRKDRVSVVGVDAHGSRGLHTLNPRGFAAVNEIVNKPAFSSSDAVCLWRRNYLDVMAMACSRCVVLFSYREVHVVENTYLVQLNLFLLLIQGPKTRVVFGRNCQSIYRRKYEEYRTEPQGHQVASNRTPTKGIGGTAVTQRCDKSQLHALSGSGTDDDTACTQAAVTQL